MRSNRSSIDPNPTAHQLQTPASVSISISASIVSSLLMDDSNCDRGDAGIKFHSPALSDSKNVPPAQLVWLSCLSLVPCTRRLRVQFPVRAHAQMSALIPSRGHAGGSRLMDISISLSLPPSEIDKNIFFKMSHQPQPPLRPCQGPSCLCPREILGHLLSAQSQPREPSEK
uniref:Uncharacterized protein n=1 Tax=Molossus molossus TaxID=27622 RepID=A0A7J8CZ01_MOLMO|nr:hypothetical protein HJG59_009484 [Molossus molossus]